MEQLRPVELKLVDELLGMSSGCVLNFNNRTFAGFFRREVGIDIYNDGYAINGGSKGKHLRAFLTIGQPRAIAKALGALWEYRETDRLGRGEPEPSPTRIAASAQSWSGSGARSADLRAYCPCRRNQATGRTAPVPGGRDGPASPRRALFRTPRDAGRTAGPRPSQEGKMNEHSVRAAVQCR
ncbi:hypothetical protein QBK99_25225 [Corticibacterium sp. UT-5YL-CI-8]|nr:hypothetical protein [Tianweitania sp. UT-5YL-CI-8]